MKTKNSYAVLGLGRYGYAVAKELVETGAEVLVVDSREDVINDVVDEFPLCKCADITDEDAIAQLGISNIDVVIIAVASNLETSVMATTLCKDAGVKTVIVKCANERQCKILSKIGADKVVLPEYESGVRLAKNLLSSGFVDILELTNNISLVEFDVKPEWVGKTLIDLNLRKKYSINVIAIQQDNDVTTEIDPNKPLEASMKLIVVANRQKLEKMR
ncbi:MAG: TrkA family potassium uptake protein [Clostridia bacterium]|nr:TrkA family potassium uptake protein [Clostridia bacterium]